MKKNKKKDEKEKKVGLKFVSKEKKQYLCNRKKDDVAMASLLLAKFEARVFHADMAQLVEQRIRNA